MDMIESFIFNIQRFAYALSTAELFIPVAPTPTPPAGEIVTTPPAGVIGPAVDSVGQYVPAGQQAPGLFDGPMFFIVWGVIIVGLYFIMIRPGRKRDKKMREMQAAIKTGDNVITSSGMFGKVMEVGTDSFVVEFGTNRGIRIPVLKSDVVAIREPKLTPPPAAS